MLSTQVRWGEAITQGWIEQSNVYDIYDATNGNHVFVAVERSEGGVRRRCAHAHAHALALRCCLLLLLLLLLQSRPSPRPSPRPSASPSLSPTLTLTR